MRMATYDEFYGSDAVSKGTLLYCNMGLHPVDVHALGNPKTHDLLQPHQQQLYLALLTLPRVLHLLERAAVDKRPVHVLDVGCGTGASLFLVQQILAARTTAPIVVAGIDKSAAACKQHKRLFHGDKRQLHYDMETQRMTAFSRHRFDLVIGVQSFQEMTAAPDAAIAELERVLKPAGLVVLADFHVKGNAFAKDFLGLLRQHSRFDLHFEQDVSHASTLGAKLSSVKTHELLEDEAPELQAPLAELLTLKKTRRYESIRLGQLQVGIFGFHSLHDDQVADDAHDVTHDDDEHDMDDDIDDIDDSMNPSFYDYKQVYPELSLLQDATAIIRQEAQAAQLVASWPNWPEDHYVGDAGEWKVFPLCYTFPAWDASKTVWVEATCVQCPETVALLRQLPGLRTALFSNLGPTTTLGAHRGWADLANDILRCHLGLVVPTLPDEECCCVVVAGQARPHREGGLLVFDDSKLHSAYNVHPTETRLVLIVDMYRPEDLPRGMAVGGHTDELDRFIAQYNASLQGEGEDDE
ncbi:Aste57867_8426 [Aphanomyces stellatus]|uniref:Aste57867_8426 protein n=1 Tax=Aphanomyces stellatus TaxID=120398 RepID=A0A485KKA3_9STRA|nr:hypothetical protein As57867_008394 [Aphanomyces stellatus]VFT85312.1 Aste57867_8426 [Aphanomyces stellatus]